MTIEKYISRLDRETLIVILLRIIKEFPIIKTAIINIANHKE